MPLATLMTDRRWRIAARTAAVLAVLALVLKCAWVCDDAFISLRTVDNLLHGHGLTWNPGERVQSYTHPLWLLVLTLAHALVRDAFWAVLGAGVAVTAAAVFLLAWRVLPTAGRAAAAAVLLLLSKSFVDYGTAGLETPLACLLLGWFVLAARPRPDEASGGAVLRLGLLLSLLALTRLDLVLLAGPVWVRSVLRAGRPRPWRRVLLGLAPLAAWEVFSVVYYGLPVANTAYAKLNTGIPVGELLVQGLWYLVATLRADPLVPAVIAAAAVLARRRDGGWAWTAGLALYLLYLVRVGGDFMVGRLLVPPFFLAVALLVRDWPGGRRQPLALAAVAAGALLVPDNPVTCPVDYDREGFFHGIADERGFYYPATGLLPRFRVDFQEHPLIRDGRRARRLMAERGAAFQVVESAGFYGYYAGPRLHMVDVYALGNVFLARLPARLADTEPRWRIGHFAREIPAGYEESLAAERNLVADPALSRLYDRVQLVTRGPLFTRARWAAIWRLNVSRPPPVRPGAGS